ncbi:MAG TPA: cysteine--tRNA ligase, partial [Actinomycetota bacterium]
NVFPHHEDEIAQSDGATGHPVVAHWVHGAHLLSEGRKMAKSAGNFYDLRDLAAMGHTEPLAVRLLFLQSRYRAQMNFTRDALSAAEHALRRWRRLVGEWSRDATPVDALEATYEERFAATIADDLDTPSAVALAADVVSTDALSRAGKFRLLSRWDGFLGLELAREAAEAAPVPSEVAKLLEQRHNARAAKDFSESDRLREQIRTLGYDVEDTSVGQQTRPQS